MRGGPAATLLVGVASSIHLVPVTPPGFLPFAATATATRRAPHVRLQADNDDDEDGEEAARENIKLAIKAAHVAGDSKGLLQLAAALEALVLRY